MLWHRTRDRPHGGSFREGQWFDRSLENDKLMAKRQVLGCKANVRTEQEAHEADKQLGRPCRLGGILTMTINHKSLYNQQYSVFARDKCALRNSV